MYEIIHTAIALNLLGAGVIVAAVALSNLVK